MTTKNNLFRLSLDRNFSHIRAQLDKLAGNESADLRLVASAKAALDDTERLADLALPAEDEPTQTMGATDDPRCRS